MPRVRQIADAFFFEPWPGDGTRVFFPEVGSNVAVNAAVQFAFALFLKRESGEVD